MSPSGTGSYALLHTDEEVLPLSALRFSRGYNDPTDLSHGYLDFDRDGKSDVFSAVPIGGGEYRWRYSSGGAKDWTALAYDSTPPEDLRFGDFNGDGYTDVFAAVPNPDGTYEYRFSSAGSASYYTLATHQAVPVGNLRFGDFNGDGRTDVFTTQDLGNGSFAWLIAYGFEDKNGMPPVPLQLKPFVQVNSAMVPLVDMQFGDVNGDGHTDVFVTAPDGTGSYDWVYSPSATGAFQGIATSRPQGIHDLLLAGNFDKLNPDPALYRGTDIFYTTLRFDGTNQWWFFDYKPSPLVEGDVPLAYAEDPLDQLRFADFNGDGVTDVFVLHVDCPATTTTTTTTTTVTVTSTTTPAPVDCSRLGGVAGMDCVCRKGLPTAACSGPAVSKLAAQFRAGCAEVDQGVAKGPGKKAHRLIGEATATFSRVRRLTKHAHKLTAACRAALDAALGDAKRRASALRTAF